MNLAWPLAAALLASMPARAEWQYARWGMSPDAVVSASGGAAKLRPASEIRRNSTDQNDSLVGGTYEAGDLRFDVSFLFSRDTKRLERVHLSLDPSIPCGRLRSALTERYGAPASRQPSQYVTAERWRDTQSNNAVALMDMGSAACVLQYSELTSPTNKGL